MSDRRLVFLHGFTQTHHHWHACARLIAQRLGDDPALAFFDMPGHGLSRDALTIEEAAPRLPALGGRGTYIGYSMGARHALSAACSGASEIERLVRLGARRVDDWPYPDGERDYEVLEDPDGNRFCVIDAPGASAAATPDATDDATAD